MAPPRFADLLVLGYRDGELDPASGFLDCLGAVRVWLERLGFVGYVPASTEEIAESLEACRVSAPRRWCPVERASELGDVILSGPESRPHLSALVCTRPLRALSAAAGWGVYTIHPRHIQRVRSVWRPIR